MANSFETVQSRISSTEAAGTSEHKLVHLRVSTHIPFLFNEKAQVDIERDVYKMCQIIYK